MSFSQEVNQNMAPRFCALNWKKDALSKWTWGDIIMNIFNYKYKGENKSDKFPKTASFNGLRFTLILLQPKHKAVEEKPSGNFLIV